MYEFFKGWFVLSSREVIIPCRRRGISYCPGIWIQVEREGKGGFRTTPKSRNGVLWARGLFRLCNNALSTKTRLCTVYILIPPLHGPRRLLFRCVPHFPPGNFAESRCWIIARSSILNKDARGKGLYSIE